MSKYKHTKLQNVYYAMRQRCNNPNNKDYKWYGGRGIGICDEWESFASFKSWAEISGYKEGYGLTIDRIDGNKGYSPDNCRWISIREQQSNKRNNRLLTFNGETHTLSQWAQITGIKRETIRDRIDDSGWSVERALCEPVKSGSH